MTQSTTYGMREMSFKVTQKKYNPLLKRTELVFEIKQEKTKGTPTRVDVRNMIATELKADFEKVYVKKIETKTGSTKASGEAMVYDSYEQATLVEPKYIIDRNASKKSSEAKE